MSGERELDHLIALLGADCLSLHTPHVPTLHLPRHILPWRCVYAPNYLIVFIFHQCDSFTHSFKAVWVLPARVFQLSLYFFILFFLYVNFYGCLSIIIYLLLCKYIYIYISINKYIYISDGILRIFALIYTDFWGFLGILRIILKYLRHSSGILRIFLGFVTIVYI